VSSYGGAGRHYGRKYKLDCNARVMIAFQTNDVKCMQYVTIHVSLERGPQEVEKTPQSDVD
jgi:hypothetical protein